MSRVRRRQPVALPPTPAPTAAADGSMSLTTAGSVLGQRAAWLNQISKTFGSKRDLFDTLGYRRSLTASDYRGRYQRNAVAARLMEAFPKATWRHGAEVIDNDDPDTETPFEQAWDALARRLNFWSVMQRTDILAGLGRYAGLLIGAAGDLEQELGSLKGPDAILYLAPYGEDELTISQWEQDSGSERYGLPIEYQLIRRTVLQDQSWVIAPNVGNTPRLVHWTRVLHVTDALLDDRVFGTPRLERVWNLLDDLDKVTGGGAEAFWLRANQGLLLAVDKDVITQPAELTHMQKEVEEYVHGMSRVMKMRGVTAQPLGADTADFGGNAEAILTQICAGVGIPRRLLEGSERGELASTQDRSNWTDRVMDRRKDMAEPHVRAFVDRLVEAKALPAPTDDDYEIVWPREEDMTLAERVQIVAVLAEANAALAATAGEPLVVPSELRDEFLHLEPLDDVLDPGETGLAPMPEVRPDGTIGPVPGRPMPPGNIAQTRRIPPDPTAKAKPKAKSPTRAKAKAARARALRGRVPLPSTFAPRPLDPAALHTALRAGDATEARRIIDAALIPGVAD